MTIKPIDPERNNGRSIKLLQIWRKGPVAIYKDTIHEHNYETVVIRAMPPHFKDNSGFDLVERYPSDEDWGTYGFTHASLADAQLKAKRLQIAYGKSPKVSQLVV